MKITTDAGPSFFIRDHYLKTIQPQLIVRGAVFADAAEQELIDAGFAFSAEVKATEYLSRAEQCRAALVRKLTAKGCTRGAIDAALDYLEQTGALSDARFSEAWLHARNNGRAEGRSRLLRELLVRGIDRVTADAALDGFCAEHSEAERCLRAGKKLLRSTRAGTYGVEKKIAQLVRLGFSYKLAEQTLGSIASDCGDGTPLTD